MDRDAILKADGDMFREYLRTEAPGHEVRLAGAYI